MNTTMFFAQFWGPIILAVGLGFFTSKGYYIRLYKDMEKEPLATLTFGIMAMIVGIFHVSIHNDWGSFNQGLVSLLGWSILIKGVAFLVVPRLAYRAADLKVSQKLVPSIGIIVLVAGIYISWVGYFM